MYNKIRLMFSNFIKRHEDKIKDLGQKAIIVAMALCVATILLRSFSKMNDNSDKQENVIGTDVYKPTDTIIKGQDITKEEFEEDSNLVNTFLNFCNNEKIEEAYNLISDECKEEKFPTLEIFKNNYYNDIFAKKRECNLQSWISNNDYIVYKARYTNDMMATGTYDETNIYQDYITLNRKNDNEKISIGSFIDSEECNIITKTAEIEATVVKKKIYIEDEEYEIYVKNNTDKTILLDNLKYSSTIYLTSGGVEYMAYKNELYESNLIIKPGQTKGITIRFIKNLSSNKKSKTIKFSNVIKDYNTYLKNEEAYNDIIEIKIKVED